MLSRRQLLATSTTTLPLFLALGACKGPAPLGGPPPLSPDTRSLLHAATAERNLIWIYKAVIAGYSELAPTLRPLLAEHEAHLSTLADRIIEPPGKKVPATVTVRPAVPGTTAQALVLLRDHEQAASRVLLSRLYTTAPSLAQLYASIAAAEATHAVALSNRTGSR
jgi:hypothetical protein